MPRVADYAIVRDSWVLEAHPSEVGSIAETSHVKLSDIVVWWQANI